MDEYLHILLTTLQHDIAFFLRSMTLFIVHVFFCNLHAVPFTWKTRDSRKCVKHFGVLGVSGLNTQG